MAEPFAIDDEMFEDWVFDALDELPDEYKAGLGPLAVLIEEAPTAEQLARVGVPAMYGLFEGVHRGGYEARWTLLPSRITIYRGTCLRDGGTLEGTRALVRRTVLHEVAHQLGIPDERIHELMGDHAH